MGNCSEEKQPSQFNKWNHFSGEDKTKAPKGNFYNPIEGKIDQKIEKHKEELKQIRENRKGDFKMECFYKEVFLYVPYFIKSENIYDEINLKKVIEILENTKKTYSRENEEKELVTFKGKFEYKEKEKEINTKSPDDIEKERRTFIDSIDFQKTIQTSILCITSIPDNKKTCIDKFGVSQNVDVIVYKKDGYNKNLMKYFFIESFLKNSGLYVVRDNCDDSPEFKEMVNTYWKKCSENKYPKNTDDLKSESGLKLDEIGKYIGGDVGAIAVNISFNKEDLIQKFANSIIDALRFQYIQNDSWINEKKKKEEDAKNQKNN